MDQMTFTTTAVTHQLFGGLRRVVGRTRRPAEADRDTGAVSLEQVMWFVAAGVAVAVIATILFQRIRDEANNSPIDTIAPPAGRTP
jgi:hypothetical protein